MKAAALPHPKDLAALSHPDQHCPFLAAEKRSSKDEERKTIKQILAEEIRKGHRISIPEVDANEKLFFTWKVVHLVHNCEHCTVVICSDDSIVHYEHHDLVTIQQENV